MPNKQIAVYIDKEKIETLCRLAFSNGWPQRVLLPVILAAEKFYESNSITTYDPGNERLFTALLSTALRSISTRRTNRKPIGKAKRGGKKHRGVEGIGSDLQNAKRESDSVKCEVGKGRDDDEARADEKR